MVVQMSVEQLVLLKDPATRAYDAITEAGGTGGFTGKYAFNVVDFSWLHLIKYGHPAQISDSHQFQNVYLIMKEHTNYCFIHRVMPLECVQNSHTIEQAFAEKGLTLQFDEGVSFSGTNPGLDVQIHLTCKGLENILTWKDQFLFHVIPKEHGHYLVNEYSIIQ